MTTSHLSQRARLLALVGYVLILFVASKIALGDWLPPTSAKGLWFYAGLASVLLGNLIVTPFYVKPADVIAYTVAGLVALLAVNVWTLSEYSSVDKGLWLGVTVYAAIILVAAVLSIVLKDAVTDSIRGLSQALYIFGDTAGTPRVLFSIIYLFALISFHRDTPKEFLTIGVAWALTVGLRPIESVLFMLIRLQSLFTDQTGVKEVGEIVGHETPNLILIRQKSESEIKFGDLLVARTEEGTEGIALALDRVGYADGVWLRAIHLDRGNLSSDYENSGVSERGAVLCVSPDLLGPEAGRGALWHARDRLIGLVAHDTDIGTLRVEVVRTDTSLAEGALLEVEISGNPVLYQIINGLTKEEILQQKNSRGFVRADAKKIGYWNADMDSFAIARWLPSPNAPVFLVRESDATPIKEAIGHFPGTNYPVRVDVDPLVTHNSAILGILGSGKSFLALELVERMIHERIKVICLDLTNQYAQELSPFYDAAAEGVEVAELQSVGPPGKTSVRQNVEEGGSLKAFQQALRLKLAAFLEPGQNAKYVKIFNPVNFDVWRQDSRPFQGNASMASVTPTEITRVFAETALDVLKEQGMTEEARCCLVLEEAHSLVPEWSAVASEGDRTAANGTAKAILQGRKFGLGCLVVTQRTANVTKSILNQCNTVFALRVFDATGMEFLKNYIGEDYAGVLSGLEDRHAVIFGRASSCRNPVLVRLNDRLQFIEMYRGHDNVNPVGGVQS